MMSRIETSIQSLTELTRGDIIQHLVSDESYVVITDHPDPIIAVRYVRVSNAREWMKVERLEPKR